MAILVTGKNNIGMEIAWKMTGAKDYIPLKFIFRISGHLELQIVWNLIKSFLMELANYNKIDMTSSAWPEDKT